jgi:hypothetical protein
MKIFLLVFLTFILSLSLFAQNDEEDITGRKAPNFKLVNLRWKIC